MAIIGNRRKGTLDNLFGGAVQPLNQALDMLLSDKVKSMQEDRASQIQEANKEKYYNDLVSSGISPQLAGILRNASERERIAALQSPILPVGNQNQQQVQPQGQPGQLGALGQLEQGQGQDPGQEQGQDPGMVGNLLGQQDQGQQQQPGYADIITAGLNNSPLLRQNSELAEKKFEFQKQQKQEDIKLKKEQDVQKSFQAVKADIDAAEKTIIRSKNKAKNAKELMHGIKKNDVITGRTKAIIDDLGLSKYITTKGTQLAEKSSSRILTDYIEEASGTGSKLIKGVLDAYKNITARLYLQKDIVHLLASGNFYNAKKEIATAKSEVDVVEKYQRLGIALPATWKKEARLLAKPKLKFLDNQYGMVAGKVFGKDTYKHMYKENKLFRNKIKDGTIKDKAYIPADLGGYYKYDKKNKSLTYLLHKPE